MIIFWKFSENNNNRSRNILRQFGLLWKLPPRRRASVKSPLGFCPARRKETPRSSSDSNSIKVPFICRGGPSNRLGREREAEKASRFAQQLRGPTFAGSCMDSPSVPTPPHPPPPPPVHTCSCLQQMFEVNPLSLPSSSSSSSSHKPKKKNKKDTQKLPLAALRTPRPGEWEGEFREEEQRREMLVGKRGRNCVRREYIFFIPAQVSFAS